MNLRVNAPAILLGASFDTIAEGIAHQAGRHTDATARGSLFRYGFPADEQEGVLNRLRALVPKDNE